MATSKTGTKKASPAKKTARSTTAAAAAPKKTVFKSASGEPNYPAIIIAEVIGTFILTAIALMSLKEIAPLYVGVTLAVAVLTIGAVSGAHINPAVTFGLWSARKLKTIMLPVYWIAQFVGAILAILMLGALNGSGYPLGFDHFTTIHWGVLFAELIGAAVFLFGILAVTSNDKVSDIAKALGVGFSLTLGVLVGTQALTTLQNGKASDYQASITSETGTTAEPKIPGELNVTGVTLNPAVALAATELTNSQLLQQNTDEKETPQSRLGLEVILGTFIGAALGANLYLLLAYVNRK